jgi:hypothetical protein
MTKDQNSKSVWGVEHLKSGFHLGIIFLLIIVAKIYLNSKDFAGVEEEDERVVSLN